MELLLHFHVNTTNREKLAYLLQQYSGISPISTRGLIQDIADFVLADIEAEPDYYVINQSAPHWQNVEFNSLIKLHRLGAFLSKNLNTVFIQTSYWKVKEYTYFLVYDKGRLRREIESTHDHLIPNINLGVPFEFEHPDNEVKTETVQMFDLDSLADYSKHLGIDLSNLFCDSSSIILKNSGSRNVLYSVEREKLQLLRQIEQLAKK